MYTCENMCLVGWRCVVALAGLAVVMCACLLVGCGVVENKSVSSGGLCRNWYWKCCLYAVAMSSGSALAYSEEEHFVQCGAGDSSGVQPMRVHSGSGLTAFQADCTLPLGFCFVLSHASDLYVWFASVCWCLVCIHSWMMRALLSFANCSDS